MQHIVTLRCMVKKIVTCEGCTSEQAQEEPFKYAVDEIESCQMDWEVTDVETVDICGRLGAERVRVRETVRKVK